MWWHQKPLDAFGWRRLVNNYQELPTNILYVSFVKFIYTACRKTITCFSKYFSSKMILYNEKHYVSFRRWFKLIDSYYRYNESIKIQSLRILPFVIRFVKNPHYINFITTFVISKHNDQWNETTPLFNYAIKTMNNLFNSSSPHHFCGIQEFVFALWHGEFVNKGVFHIHGFYKIQWEVSKKLLKLIGTPTNRKI